MAIEYVKLKECWWKATHGIKYISTSSYIAEQDYRVW